MESPESLKRPSPALPACRRPFPYQSRVRAWHDLRARTTVMDQQQRLSQQPYRSDRGPTWNCALSVLYGCPRGSRQLL